MQLLGRAGGTRGAIRRPAVGMSSRVGFESIPYLLQSPCRYPITPSYYILLLQLLVLVLVLLRKLLMGGMFGGRMVNTY